MSAVFCLLYAAKDKYTVHNVRSAYLRTSQQWFLSTAGSASAVDKVALSWVIQSGLLILCNWFLAIAAYFHIKWTSKVKWTLNGPSLCKPFHFDLCFWMWHNLLDVPSSFFDSVFHRFGETKSIKYILIVVSSILTQEHQLPLWLMQLLSSTITILQLSIRIFEK